MKPTKENMDIESNRAYFEGRSVELKAQNLILPDNIPAFFSAVENRATRLPTEFSDFEYGLKRYAEWGRHAHDKGDDKNLRKYIYIITQNLHILEQNTTKHNQLAGNSEGGKAGKRSQWAEDLAGYLAGLGMTFPEAWKHIPEDENSALELDEDTSVYRTGEGEKVVAFDPVTNSGELGKPLARSTFEKYYFRKAKNKADSN
jgi:hypothetical protein